MRIDWLKIGKPLSLEPVGQQSLFDSSESATQSEKIIGFKNLQNFEIDFDKNQLSTVLIGRNGSGKSNLIEALVLIFRDLDLGTKPSFTYEIKYYCQGKEIYIVANPENKAGHTRVTVDGKNISFAAFQKNKREYLPKHVFAYYSGPSNRLEKHFDKHQKNFYDALLKGKDSESIRPLFYARLIHSYFVLLAYFSFEDQQSRQLLENILGIEALESVLFVLKKPDWAKSKNDRSKKDGDPRFWYARGVVKDFLSDLYKVSLAPILTKEPYTPSFNKRPIDEERLFLFVKDQGKLAELASLYKNNVNFFKMLESTYISDLIREVRIKVRKRYVDGSLTFTELSEGEQQLLTVLGLLKFTNETESLFLLDEPDTHLNPKWKYDYLKLLEQGVGKQTNSHLIISTHDPLLIGGLEREQVQMLEDRNGTIVARHPAESPKGMGVDGLLKSELFGLATTLDPDTQNKINRRDELFAKINKNKFAKTKISTFETSAEEIEKMQEEMRGLSDELAEMGFTQIFRDPMYGQFVVGMAERNQFKKPNLTLEELKKQNEIAKAILEEMFAEEEK